MEHITPANGNPPIGPYTPGIKAGNMCFTSGQLGGTDPDIAVQAENACKNVGAILEAAGFGFEDVVKTTCYLTDIKDFAAFNAVYAKFFVSKPARSCFAVKELPVAGAKIEIEAVAVK
ncbi:MAG: regulator [Firmicutes bacterium]|jgi:reactive intermediate/imine deaminase|nr:regulator [Bacillota bacterium]MBQ2058919.1 regulator [Bacillota bacterium]MBQ4372332.1 regulator [Bacillota bacterium]